jgi:hypothetical protein
LYNYKYDLDKYFSWLIILTSKNKFKKSLILSFVALFTVSVLAAQTTIKPTVGLNFTDFSNDISGAGEFKAKTGWQIGGSIAFGKKFYIEPGIFYTSKSTEFQSSVSPSIPDESTSINGIRIPLTVGLNLLGNEKTMFSLRGFGGLSGFFLTSVGDDLDKDDFESTNFGVFAGAGIDVWKVFLDLSYEWSLTNVQKNVSQIDVGQARSLYINAGIRINL